MADYYTVLQRAVSALPENSGAGRRAIYDKARAALVRQLETIQPPLPAAEIAKQRLSLEEAVRRIEADVARSAPPRPAAPAAPPPAAAEPRREPPPRPPITRPEPSRAEAPRAEPPRPEAGKPEASRPETPKPETLKVEAAKSEPGKSEPGKSEPGKSEPGKSEPGKPDALKTEPPAGEAPRTDAPRPEARRLDPPRPAPRIEAPLRAEPRSPVPRPDNAPPPAPKTSAPSLDGMRRDDGAETDTARADAPRLPPTRRPDATTGPVVPPPRAEAARPPRPEASAGAIVAPLPGIPGDELDGDDGDERGGRREDRQARKEKRRLARLGRGEEPADTQDDAGAAVSDAPEGEAADADAAWLDLPPDAAPLRLPSKRRRNWGPLIAALVVLVIVAGGAAAAYLYRDVLLAQIDSMLAEDPQPAQRRTATQAQNGGEQLAPKDEDRLPSANGQNGAPAATDTRAVPTTRIVTPQTPDAADDGGAIVPPPAGDASPAPAPDAAAPPGDGAAPADGAAADPAAEVAPSPEAAGMTGPSRGILYEEGETAGAKGAALKGDVKWEMVRESIGGAPPEPIVRATIAVPERQATTTIIFRRNRDDALPASHLIEVAFELPVEFPGGGISNLPGLIMKVTENARGDALIGASARVSDGLFWIALSSSETDETHNLELLKDRGWIDLPMLYDNGRRAILTVEKGSDGAAAIDQAITAWASEKPN
jgi:hypothetical protein